MQVVSILLISLIAAAFLLFAVYLFLIMPRLKKPVCGLTPLMTRPFAHRGYFCEEKHIPQNTLAAFSRAVQEGYGIELDVHLTADHRLAVIHDDYLMGLCGHDGVVEDMTLDELKKLRVQGSDQSIPTLREVLDTVGGKVPLLIEIKGLNVLPLVPLVMQELQGYTGLYCIESFNPFHLRWLKKHRPDILRGQLACKNGWQHAETLRLRFRGFVAEKLLFNFISRPDFIAYSYRDVQTMAIRINQRFGAVLAGWTIRDENGLAESKAKGVQCFIFENIHP